MNLARLGKMITERRSGKGIREVAAEIGISPATLSRVESGRVPDLETFSRICTWLKLDPNKILGVSVEPMTEVEPTHAAAVHLKADAALPEGAADDLAVLITMAHHELSRRMR